MAHVMKVKADIDGDVRRINITLHEGAPAETLRAIRTSIAQGFDMEEAVLPMLKYRDEEGDLCTLVAASVHDMLELNNGGALRLFASQAEATLPHSQADLETPLEAQVAGSSREAAEAEQDSISVAMRTMEVPPLDSMKSDGRVCLKQWIQDQLCLEQAVKIANIKGYGSGLQSIDYHRDALSRLKGYKVVVFDGDWRKDESFTSLVQPFLAEDPSRQALAFRKAEGNLEGFLNSWSGCPQLSQITLALVPSSYIVEAKEELRTLGLDEKHLDNTALGWLTLRFSGSSHALAVGGGQTTLNEAKTCLQMQLQQPSAARVSWSVLNIGRKTKDGEESPEELIATVDELRKRDEAANASVTSTEHDASAPVASAHEPHLQLRATALDNTQVFVSNSMSALRSVASDLLGGARNAHRMQWNNCRAPKFRASVVDDRNWDDPFLIIDPANQANTEQGQ